MLSLLTGVENLTEGMPMKNKINFTINSTFSAELAIDNETVFGTTSVSSKRLDFNSISFSSSCAEGVR